MAWDVPGLIAAADQLEGIVVPAIGYKRFLPAWRSATDKGIAVANTPNAPTQEVLDTECARQG
jgi:phosphoglycerate dehydrogenase-like enzyme